MKQHLTILFIVLVLTSLMVNGFQITGKHVLGVNYDKSVERFCREKGWYFSVKESTRIICKRKGLYYWVGNKFTGKVPALFRRKLRKAGSRLQFSSDPRKNWFSDPITCSKPSIRDPGACRMVSKAAVDVVVKKPCYFVHGVGQRGSNTLTTTFQDYWGDVQVDMSQCSETWFLHLDTKSYGFDNPVTAKNFCRLVGAGKDGYVRDRYIFTHSMGGLITTYAFSRGYCFMDYATTVVYMSQPPLKGSRSAVFVNELCQGKHINETFLGINITDVAYQMDYCDPVKQEAWPAYQTMFPWNQNLQGLSFYASQMSSGFLCGECYDKDMSPVGWQACSLTTLGIKDKAFATALGALQSIAQMPGDNDGMVSVDSCVPDGLIPANFTVDPTNRYYQSFTNHQQGTGYFGDGSNVDRQPVTWFENRFIQS